MESLHALIGWIGESSTDRVVHTQRLDLSSVSLLINDNGRVDVGSIFSPVRNFIIDLLVVGVFRLPIRLLVTCTCETLLDASKCVIKVEIECLVSTPRTGDIYDTVACTVNFVDVIPPQSSVVYFRS